MTDLEEVMPTETRHDRSTGVSVARGADAEHASAPSTLRCSACNAVSETVLCATCAGELETLIEAAQDLSTRAHCAAKAGALVDVRDWSGTMDECSVMLTRLAGQIGRGAKRLSAPPSAPATEPERCGICETAPATGRIGEGFPVCRNCAPAFDMSRALPGPTRISPSPAPSAPDLSEFDRLLMAVTEAVWWEALWDEEERTPHTDRVRALDQTRAALRSWVATALEKSDAGLIDLADMAVNLRSRLAASETARTEDQRIHDEMVEMPCRGCGGRRNWQLNGMVQAFCSKCASVLESRRGTPPAPSQPSALVEERLVEARDVIYGLRVVRDALWLDGRREENNHAVRVTGAIDLIRRLADALAESEEQRLYWRSLAARTMDALEASERAKAEWERAAEIHSADFLAVQEQNATLSALRVLARAFREAKARIHQETSDAATRMELRFNDQMPSWPAYKAAEEAWNRALGKLIEEA